MSVNNGILAIKGPGWKMAINLRAMAEMVGKYRTVTEYGRGRVKELQCSVTKAKKICRLIVENADPEEFVEVTEIFKQNPKLMKIWEDTRCKAGM